MKLGGIDPAIIRELSGAYKPFTAAFKELLCNAYDADTTEVRIAISEDLRSIEILDNGRGMSLDEFHNEFVKIGGSYTRRNSEFTPRGRPKIGSKGIGFLAVARYCSRMDIQSKSASSRKGFHATLDFQYLLGLENEKDLGEIDDFYVLNYHRKSEAKPFTRIVISGIKEHVVEELKAPRRSGNVKNVSSMSGLERFIWHISRNSPLNIQAPEALERLFFRGLRRQRNFKYIERVYVRRKGEKNRQILTYPVYGSHLESFELDQDLFIPLHIEKKGLHARGYILAQPVTIHPAEYRGISIRVRNASVGTATFFGAEKTLTGARKAALSQITGELFVLEGLDAVDAINPGRESFYEENEHYRLLKHEIVGSSEAVSGALGKAISVVLRRSMLENGLKARMLKVSKRRETLLDIAGAINHYAINGDGISAGLVDYLNNGQDTENGLSKRKTVNHHLPPEIHGFEIFNKPELFEDFHIDWGRRQIFLNYEQEKWSMKIYCYGRYYDVELKDGTPKDPICEIDNMRNQILINWNHPVKQHLDEASFMRSAVLWKFAFHSSNNDVNRMMELGLRLLSYRSI
jgi:hypothetical protein